MKAYCYRNIILFLIVFLGGQVAGQSYILTGTVTDSITAEPLAFVNIIYDDSGKGIVSSLDGKFDLRLDNKPEKLLFSYVGYNHKTIIPANLLGTEKIKVTLCPKLYLLDEIYVRPGVNPAHRIIELASANRKTNHPETVGSFSYIAYDKMVFTTDMDSLAEPKNQRKRRKYPEEIAQFETEDAPDSTAREFLSRQYLLMMESISSRKFIYPDKNKEEIIASRISGFERPSFVIMAKQFKSFSFYDDFIALADKKYLNPINPVSTSKYFFLLEDSLFTARNDTVFIISFRPKNGMNFDGLKGVLYINSYKWAIQNVIAEACEQQNELFSVKIQQKYELVDGSHWFPVQLNTNLIFNNIVAQTNTRSMKVIGIGKSYLLNIRLNPELDKREFSGDYVNINESAHRIPGDIWDRYRPESLTQKEEETYHTVDSIGKVHHFDQTFNTFESFMTGYLPGNYFDLDLRSLVSYNSFEGWRFGLGGITNKNLSGLFSAGGHVAYGLRDRNWKYGFFAEFHFSIRYEGSLRIGYLDDLEELGSIGFLEQLSLVSSESYRKYMVENMDNLKSKQLSISWKMFKYLKSNVFFNISHVSATGPYMFSISEHTPEILINRFDYTEAGVMLRYAFGEGFMVTPRGNKFSLGTKYPIVYLNISRGMYWFGGDFSFTRIETKLDKTFTTRRLGDSKIRVVMGYASGNIPYSRLYSGNGSYKTIGIETENSFSTMRFNEFLSNSFFSMFYKQDFGKLFFRAKKFSPTIALATNIGFGWLEHAEQHRNIEFSTLSKGFYESGILLNNLIEQKFIGYGIGLFYRYGPYSFSRFRDNLAVKITFLLNI